MVRKNSSRKGKHLSAAHKKAISEGLKRYHKNKRHTKRTEQARFRRIPKRKVGTRGKGSYKNFVYHQLPNKSYGWIRKRK